MIDPLVRFRFVVPVLALVAGACGDSAPAVQEEPPPPIAEAQDEPVEPAEADVTEVAEEAEEEEPDFSGVMSAAEWDPDAPRGVRVRTPEALDGATIVMPLNSRKVHLVDLGGEVLHTWETDSAPGAWCYLLDDGTLLRAGRVEDDPKFRGGGIGGLLQRFAPDGSVLWRYTVAGDERHQHHDLEPLPNGNVLLIAWERKTAEEAIARGRLPEAVGAPGLWPDAILEVRPVPPDGGEIVWEWHAWDHLVQDVDPDLPNYGALHEHPGRIDVNAGYVPPEQVTEEERAAEEELQEQMAALGYAGGDEEEDEGEDDGGQVAAGDDPPPASRWEETGDWLHTNAVDYHPELDLIVLSSPHLCELWVIDHSTTTAEAASSSGGRRGRGGDLLWRWGNPATYGAGTEVDQKLFYQHDPTWLLGADDLRLLVFNNGGDRPDGGDWSSVDELVLPFDPERGFLRDPGRPFGPAEPAWSWSDPGAFYSAFISGAERLPNGNTLVCSGAAGRLFEVTRSGEIVWDYYNPLGGDVDPPEHAGRAPPLALFRGKRIPRDHPGLAVLLERQ